jgi:hypothetical protein
VPVACAAASSMAPVPPDEASDRELTTNTMTAIKRTATIEILLNLLKTSPSFLLKNIVTF